ncbi:hypothetical protein EKI51_04290 [Corynebacterium sanguinis]|nr:hypothetical protein EKI51_04290 [Corynebacterium sanguinis]
MTTAPPTTTAAPTGPAAAPAPAAPAVPAPAPAAVPAPAPAPVEEAAAPVPAVPAPALVGAADEEVGGGVGLPPPPPPFEGALPESVLPSSTFLAVSAFGADGTGTGRFSADFASCSDDIAWYMSNPTKDRNLYVMYGANAAMNISATPAIGSEMDARSASMGAETWPMATRKITTRTSLEKMRAMTKVAHLANHPLVASHVAPARATGPNTMATSSRALRMSSENHTIAAALIASPARKIVRIAPTPGAVMLMVARPAARSPIWVPIPSIVLPVAWTIPTASWSVTSSSNAVSVMTRNDPSTLLARPRAARLRAVGSRWMSPVMSCKQKNTSMMKTATPNRTL